jgi:K+-transporting ATPase KdpF subunit
VSSEAAIGAIVTVAILAYLFYTLLHPEKF